VPPGAAVEAFAASDRPAARPFSSAPPRHATIKGMPPPSSPPGEGVRVGAHPEPARSTEPARARSSETASYPPESAGKRVVNFRPIPREEVDERRDSSPDASAVLASMATPPPRSLAPPRSDTSRVMPIPMELPSVIVDVGAEYASLLGRVLEGGVGSDEAFAELVKNGETSMPLLIAKFPGPLHVDRHRARDQLPAASQCGPILELVVAMRRIALPFVTVRSTSPDVDTRFWATHVLGELRYPEAANALVPRLFDEEVSVRRIARRAAAALVGAGASGKPILQGLDFMIRSVDEPVSRRVMAIDTTGEIRAGAMVPALIAVLGDPSKDVSEAARRALLVITRQDFGHDVRRWSEWWTRSGSQHRIEWLIEALMHDLPSIRRAAGDELKQLTKEYFGYYDDLPKRERERAQLRYREWWQAEGKLRFR
jgi:hypothetical protein